MEQTKGKVVLKNTMYGVINNACNVVLQLVTRKLFLSYFGIEYLSVSQIVNNLLAVLAFTELGLSNAVIFMLYQPVALGDEKKARRIVGMYRSFNRIVGLVIAGIGLILLPFLHLFIRTDLPAYVVNIIYIMMLFSTVSTYFYTYRIVLLEAYQEKYVSARIMAIVSIVRALMECCIIIITENFFIYLSVGIITSVIQNALVYFVTGRRHPFVKGIKRKEVESDERKELLNNVKSMFAIKIAAIVINNTDNILVSLINTLMVGICSNYTLVTNQLKSLLSILFSSEMNSIGIACVHRDAEGKYKLFQQVLLLNMYLVGVCGVCLSVMWDDFIVLWLGEKYLLSTGVKYSILLNFIMTNIGSAVWIFRDSNGLFTYVRLPMILYAVLNIILSIILGRIFGVAGVYIATVISEYATTFWYDSNLLFRRLFEKKNSVCYMLFIIANIILIVVLGKVFSCFFSRWEVSVLYWIMKGMISAIGYSLVFSLLYGRTEAFYGVTHRIVSSFRRNA